MVLSIIGDWEYTPTFMGNKEMVITLHQLSGSEELELGIGKKRDAVKWVKAVVKKIKNPIKLDFGKGTPSNMKPEHIASIGELKDLYFELLIEYNNHTTLKP